MDSQGADKTVEDILFSLDGGAVWSPRVTQLILASTSPWRAALLRNAGITCGVTASGVDERAVEDALGAEVPPEDRAQILAEAKALAVSERETDAVVIGCDQILSIDGAMMHKAEDMEQARRRLLALSGRTHSLHSALALALNGEVLWSDVVTAHMTMRKLDPGFIGRHLAQTGEAVLGSVGCYQIEGPGLQLFERIDGDYWTIIGLPVLPLLRELRERGLIDG
jgi:septum formation protein